MYIDKVEIVKYNTPYDKYFTKLYGTKIKSFAVGDYQKMNKENKDIHIQKRMYADPIEMADTIPCFIKKLDNKDTNIQKRMYADPIEMANGLQWFKEHFVDNKEKISKDNSTDKK